MWPALAENRLERLGAAPNRDGDFGRNALDRGAALAPPGDRTIERRAR
jgi:hypothetical protein